MAGAIADEQLMLQQQRLRSDGSDTAWAEEFHQRDQKVDAENEEVTHRANRIMTTSTRKTALHGRITSYYEFASRR